ncbi:MAG: lipid-A-disaccharide synthase [Verrucomicrobiota bacterium]
MTLFLVAGEASGDTHGVELMEALRRRCGPIAWKGLGGPAMKAHAPHPDFHDWLEEAAVLGLWEVLKKYPWFKQRFRETVARLMAEPPEAVILIDYPGFNLRLARALRKKNFPGKIIFYISPQVWAWNRGRIPAMARTLDLMLCIFPFEKALYQASGLPTEFVGHPLVDELAEVRAQEIEREPGLIGLFPGSREREVEALLPEMLQAITLLNDIDLSYRFVVSAANEGLEKLIQERLRAFPDALRCTTIQRGESRRLMRRCQVAAVASGTATLEAAFLGLPYCLVYKVAPLTYSAGRMLVRIPYLGIVNILADRPLVKELLQGNARGEKIAGELKRLLDNAESRRTLQREFHQLTKQLGLGGTHERAAEAIADLLA